LDIVSAAMLEAARHSVFRTVVVYIAAFGIVTLALGEGTYLYARHELSVELDANMASRMAMLERAFADGGTPAVQRAMRSYDERGARTFGYVLTDPHGVRLRRMAEVPKLAPGWGQIGMVDHDDAGRVDAARTLTRVLRDGATLTIVADRDFIERFDMVTTMFVFVALALLFLFAAGGALALERTVRRRIATLNNTARAIFAGDLNQRVPISARRDEFDAIASTVNSMLDQMNAMLGDVRRVSSYVAHDLRVPLVRLRDHLHRGSSAGIVDMDAIEKCEDIIHLFGAILRIGEIDGKLIARNAANVDLSALIAELSGAHIAVAEDAGRTLTCDVEPDVHLAGDRDLLAQMLINLIDNALRHTPAGAHIAITLSRHDHFAELCVADDGPGIGAEQRAHLVDRDRRLLKAPGDRERLGLKLVAAIVTGHEGSIALLDNAPGLRVDIRLPFQLSRLPPEGAGA
jgi:signal transduction histidine kinase